MLVGIIKTEDSFIELVKNGGGTFREYTKNGRYIPHLIKPIGEDTVSIKVVDVPDSERTCSHDELLKEFGPKITNKKIVKYN